jgi:hypothetical protein
MHYKQVIRILFIIVGLFMSSCAFAANGLDLGSWTEERVQLSDLEFTFRVPGGQSREAVSRPTVRHVDLNRDLNNQDNGIGLYNHMWDFETGVFKQVMGALTFTIGVYRRPPADNMKITSLDELEKLTNKKLSQRYTARNEKLRSEGRGRFIVEVPGNYKKVVLNGKEWLTYSLGGQLDQTLYATPVTADHYLEVTFAFSDNSHRQETNWRKQAQEVADKIAASFQLN